MFILFGLAGTGKTYVGTILQKYFGFYLYDGDNDLTDEMKKALTEKRVFTDAMRDVFFQNLIKSVQKLQKIHAKLTIAQTCIKEKYRLQILQSFPAVKFILIKSKMDTRLLRLAKRKQYPFDKDYICIMDANFEKPRIPHVVIENNKEGSVHIREQLRSRAGL